ncbi:type II toxin-antitoxin system RelE/ParE family toxin [Pseudomonas benzenivorans]|uniref:Type II toxin-antitoxin system RelE/ParE family toxin n=1 Tax=Pseudomonas benzenivorans TaxID=556533 RepID=A0ABZ0PTN6_9PSED|nr:type II toxin-antitoxin system RelE/ParE family toxin [Pseudomonas benzenivorans]WPC04515.1 type II toxin-antitoxin system RelE/ParE family toxin [Pseudomonas benzenivorans]
MSKAPYTVLMTAGAERDLESIYDYIVEFDSLANADHVLEHLLQGIRNLERFPERGAHPRELSALGIREYRQALYKPYRIIYRILGEQVHIYLIADGRRDMQSLLYRRLLE